MNLLLDTHVFLWFISGDARLPAVLREAIIAPSNQMYLSVVSIWEATIKYQLGKLPLPEEAGTYLPAQRARHMISSLPLDEASVGKLVALPAHHRDPFDRMLVCQAIEHDLVIATVDTQIRLYQAPTFGLA